MKSLTFHSRCALLARKTIACALSVLMACGDLTAAVAPLQEAVRLWESMGHKSATYARLELALVHLSCGDGDAAARAAQAGVSAALQSDRPALAWALEFVAALAREDGEALGVLAHRRPDSGLDLSQREGLEQAFRQVSERSDDPLIAKLAPAYLAAFASDEDGGT